MTNQPTNRQTDGRTDRVGKLHFQQHYNTVKLRINFFVQPRLKFALILKVYSDWFVVPIFRQPYCRQPGSWVYVWDERWEVGEAASLFCLRHLQQQSVSMSKTSYDLSFSLVTNFFLGSSTEWKLKVFDKNQVKKKKLYSPKRKDYLPLNYFFILQCATSCIYLLLLAFSRTVLHGWIFFTKNIYLIELFIGTVVKLSLVTNHRKCIA